MTHEDYHNSLPSSEKARLNELVIWAVNRMVETESHIFGSITFLTGRLTQIQIDTKLEGWRRGSERFRASIYRWCENHGVSYATQKSDLLLTGQ